MTRATDAAIDTPSDGDDRTKHDAEGESKGVNALVAVLVIVGLVVVGAASVAVGYLAGPDGEQASVGATSAGDTGYASIPFTTVDGGTETLAAYEGQPMVLNFFAAWCPPCRAELPDFQAVSLANPDVTFVGISHDLDQESWRTLVQDVGVTYDTFYQPGAEIWNELGGQAMPTTVFISSDGEVLQSHTGLLTADRLQATIDELDL